MYFITRKGQLIPTRYIPVTIRDCGAQKMNLSVDEFKKYDRGRF